MNVQVNNLAKAQISKKFISDWMTNAFRLTKSKQLIKDLSVAVVSEQEIKAINKKYRNINNITDVLSFADPAEIIICWDKLKQQAKLKKLLAQQEQLQQKILKQQVLREQQKLHQIKVAQQQGVVDQYKAMILQKLHGYWHVPADIDDSLHCMYRVELIPLKINSLGHDTYIFIECPPAPFERVYRFVLDSACERSLLFNYR